MRASIGRNGTRERACALAIELREWDFKRAPDPDVWPACATAGGGSPGLTFDDE